MGVLRAAEFQATWMFGVNVWTSLIMHLQQKAGIFFNLKIH
jgi:hypothetical protein